MDEQEQPETSEGEGIQGFVSRALRRKMPGSYEQLLCQHLIRSVAEEPMEKLRLVAEAAYMTPKMIVDEEVLNTVYNVATSFAGTDINIDPSETLYFGKIAWAFQCNEENYKKYISPWFHGFGRVWLMRGEEFPEDKEGWERFWLATAYRKLFPTSIEYLKTSFIAWAMPHVMRMFEQLSKLISPDLYETLLEKMKV